MTRMRGSFIFAMQNADRLCVYATAFKQSAISDPALLDARCLRGPFPVTYSFLAPRANELLCMVNTVFKALTENRESLLVADGFARWLFVALAILGVDSARTGQPWLVRRINWFMLAAQIFTGAVTLPVYFSITSIWASKHNPPKAPILAERAWAALLAAVGGYLVPTYYVEATKWSYGALSIWQIFPVYLMVLQTILPVLLGPLVHRTSSSVPILLIGLSGVVLSAQSHFAMFGSGVPLEKIFWPFWNYKAAQGLPEESHVFFLFDMAGCVTALSLYLVLAYGGHGTASKIGSLIVLAILTALVGPGGAAAAFWAGTVVFAPEHGKVDEKRD